MATTVVEKVKVTELTKFGFKDGTGVYVNWSKNLSDAEKTPVVPGRAFEMELYVADSGKKYVNKVLAETGAQDQAPVKRSPGRPAKIAVSTQPGTPLPPTTTPKTGVDAPMTRQDWDAKDRRISRQGAIQAAVQALSGQVPVESLATEAELLAEDMLAFVNKVSE